MTGGHLRQKITANTKLKMRINEVTNDNIFVDTLWLNFATKFKITHAKLAWSKTWRFHLMPAWRETLSAISLVRPNKIMKTMITTATRTRCRSNYTKLYWPATWRICPPWSVTDDDDRRQRASLVCPYTMCRRASNEPPLTAVQKVTQAGTIFMTGAWPWPLPFNFEINDFSSTHRGTFVCQVWWATLHQFARYRAEKQTDGCTDKRRLKSSLRLPLGMCNNNSIYITYATIRYDTVDWRALKSWRDGQLTLAQGTKTKNKGKNKNKNRVARSEETVQAKVRGGSPRGRSETTGVGFVKQVGFKPGVKERGCNGCVVWWIRRGRSDGWRNRWVRNRGTGTRIR